MHMDWDDLLFAHYTVDPAVVSKHIPAGLELETWEGKAWIGVVPFRMAGVRPRFIPRIPGLSDFAELNVRTYVRRGGLPGVFFFSLDAASPFAVRAARRFFHLPYFDAGMQVHREGAEYVYASRRTHWGAAEARFEARYAPAGASYKSRPGTLDDWLTARYCFYAADSEGNILRCDIHHKPWRLQPATASITANTLGEWLGFNFSGQTPHLLFSEHTAVVAWLPEFLGR
jgi:uncharacterized protein YqjF (DUF2071 family)